MNKAGIYQIINTDNGKRYIGSSVDVPRRLKAHADHLDLDTHVNAHLQRAYNKYGEGKFLFLILATCDASDAQDVEQRHFDAWQEGGRWDNLYNTRKTAGGGSDCILNSEQAEEILHLYRDEKASTLESIGSLYNVNMSVIHALISGKTHRNVPGPRHMVDYTKGHINGNAHGEDNHNSTLTTADVFQIRTLAHETDLGQSQIAERFGTSVPSVSRIVNGVRYVDTPGPIKGVDY